MTIGLERMKYLPCTRRYITFEIVAATVALLDHDLCETLAFTPGDTVVPVERHRVVPTVTVRLFYVPNLWILADKCEI